MVYQKMRLSYAFYYMPARFYDVSKPDSFCLREFLDTNPDQTWYENLPLTDIVCTRYIAQKSVGCKHFVRGCELQCPVCHKFCMCQFCHEDLDHDMDPSQVTTMRCVYCKEVQPKQQCCRKCKRVLGVQYDAASSTFSSLGDEGAPFFRCDKCNKCVPGHPEQMTHCDKCCRCVPTATFSTHLCVPDEGDCSICLGDLKDSAYSTILLNCGHSLH